ncbi:MAG: NAD(P)H-hydrate dehydratase [Hyphomicrobiaceae bacterium]
MPETANDLALLTCEQMAAADRAAVVAGVPSLDLMEHAGRAVADVAERLLSPGGRVVTLCGPGNNGGDGFVAARILSERGFDVRVLSLGPVSELRGDAAHMAALWAQRGVSDTSAPILESEAERLGDGLLNADLIIDALFGAGLSRPLSGRATEVVEALNARRHCSLGAPIPVIAVDLPSGLDGDSGSVSGDCTSGVAVNATHTVTFFRRKPAHLLMPGRRFCGETTVADIGIPSRVLDHLQPTTFANHPALWRNALPVPRPSDHKYARGHAIIVSGNIEMSGAARLAARACLRVGAGLVTIAAPEDALAAHAAQLNAVLLRRCESADTIAAMLDDRRVTSVVIGPGLGLCDAACAMLDVAVSKAAGLVIDADAITLAARSADAFSRAIRDRSSDGPVVLTPHEGEFARLFPDLAADASPHSKLERARRAAARTGAVVVLKGPDTVIAEPSGRAAINDNAPPTLATAGSGDVLAGFVAGLLAQGMSGFEAASAAVWLHGACAGQFGPGLIAEDLADQLPFVLSGL